jgi:putative oxidoreductase
MVLHGWSKIQSPFNWMGPDAPVPGILQALAAVSEFGGGLALIVGFLTPLACLGIMSTMFVAALKHIQDGGPFVGKGGYELAAVHFVVALCVLLAGPGKVSLDALLFGKKKSGFGRY